MPQARYRVRPVSSRGRAPPSCPSIRSTALGVTFRSLAPSGTVTSRRDRNNSTSSGSFEGSVATANVGQAKAGRELGLGSNAEKGRDEITLSVHVVCWCGRHQSLADHRHRLIACDRLVGCHEALEAQPRTDQPFDAPVILLDDVIGKFHLS